MSFMTSSSYSFVTFTTRVAPNILARPSRKSFTTVINTLRAPTRMLMATAIAIPLVGLAARSIGTRRENLALVAHGR